MKKRKLIIIVIFIVLLSIGAYFFFTQKNNSLGQGRTGQATQNFKIVPLSQEEKQKVFESIIETDFIKDIPEKYPVAITFFNFGENGKRIIQDSFLIGKNEFLSEGNPEVYLALHSKYISELNKENFCEVIQKANEAGDLAFNSKSNKASLLLKYRSMLKYRDCFGF